MSAGGAHLGDSLSALIDGELPAREAEAARAHLAGCALCRSEHAAVGQARSAVRALAPVEPPASFFTRVVDDPREGAAAVNASRRRAMGLAALAGCAAAAVAVLGVASPPDPATSPPVDRFIEAHATAVGGGDPVSRLAPVAVPVSFHR